MRPKEFDTTTGKFLRAMALFIFVALFLGYQVFLTEPSQESASATTSTPSTPSVQGVSTDPKIEFGEFYFTSPIRPYNFDNNQGGIENNLIDKINSSKTSIHGAFFEFDLQNVADALIAAKQRGVEVQLVYDNEYSDPDPQMKQMIKAGIETVPDDRSALMHNKFVVVDNECVWTGSFNITVNAAYKNNENGIYLCDPDLAENYELEFMEMFTGQFGITSPSSTPHHKININGTLVENYFAPEDNVMDKIISVVGNAKSSINFLAFSFTHDGLASTMINLQKSGVLVGGVFETRGASAESSQCGNLLSQGANIFLDGNPYTLHDKVIVIDGEIVITGSFNFSESADTKNDENTLIIHNSSVAQMYAAEIKRIILESSIPKIGCQ